MEEEEEDDAEDDSLLDSSESEVEVVGTRKNDRGGGENSSDREEDELEDTSMTSTYEDAVETEKSREDKNEEEVANKGGGETVASALGLTPAGKTGSTPKATFSGDTVFNQKQHPGSKVRRLQQQVLNPYPKQHQTRLKPPKPRSTMSMTTTRTLECKSHSRGRATLLQEFSVCSANFFASFNKRTLTPASPRI